MKHAGRRLGGSRRGGAVSWTPWTLAPRGHEGAAWWLSLELFVEVAMAVSTSRGAISRGPGVLHHVVWSGFV
jgi:hypothetical protein